MLKCLRMMRTNISKYRNSRIFSCSNLKNHGDLKTKTKKYKQNCDFKDLQIQEIHFSAISETLK